MAVSLFDARFYRAANPDLASFTDAQALQHFQSYGLNEGRAFSPFVDLNFYRSSNPDLAAARLTTNQQLYDHLRNHGVAEGRRFSEFTDINFYLTANSDVRTAFTGNRELAFNHLKNNGVAEGRQFSQFIDINFYLAANSDVRTAFSGNRVQALQHLELNGLKEGRQFSTNFSTSFYRTVYSDLFNLTNIQLLRHFEANGLKEGRASSETFNVTVYLANNADLKAAGFTNQLALEHFILSGQRQGRPGADYAGNTLATARNLGALTSSRSYLDFVGRGDAIDYYQFSLSSGSNINVSLNGLRADANVRLLNSSGSVIQTSAIAGTAAEVISRALDAGTYYIQVYSASTSASSNYNLSLSATLSPAVNASLYWTKQLGTTSNDYSKDVAVDSTGNVYVTGSTYGSIRGNNAGLSDIWIAKYDSTGNLLWTQQYGTSGYDDSYQIQVDGSGNVYLTGNSRNSGTRNSIWVAKYSSNGVLQWIQDIAQDPYSNYIHGLTVDSVGNAYVTGATSFSLSGLNQGFFDAWVAKYDSNGIRSWIQQLGSSESEFSRDVSLDSYGNVYIAGYTDGSLGGSNSGSSDIWIAKYNNNGSLQWKRQFGSSGDDSAFSIVVDSSGNLYLSGRTDGLLSNTSAGSSDAWLAKYDGNGNRLWLQQWGTTSWDSAYGVAVDSFSNSVYVTGNSRDSSGNFGDSWVRKYNSTGSLQWTKQSGVAGNTSSWGISVDQLGNLYAVGGTTGSVGGSNAGGNDAWVTKYQVDQAGNIFNSIYGYGLVNAAAAVARVLGQPIFADVADLGGNNWGDDLVKAPEVWARGYTGQGITVAVIDSGVDMTHSDLSANIWRNTREIANNGIDDDGNGYIDDVNGWNFGANNNNVMPGSMTVPGNGHGTHVAGTIAGVNNGFGITGVAYNSKIMPIKIGEVSSGNYFINPGNLATAIRYAVDNGARVINMSVGWSGSSELESAMAYAASRNVITISSAGNSSSPTPGIPAAYATQYGISVGAVDSNRTIANFSNRAGTDPAMQHIVAPGVGVYSTLPGNTYASWQGTSMAAPHVAGVVALMLSANSNLTASQVRQILTNSSTGLNFSSLTAAVTGQSQEVSL